MTTRITPDAARATLQGLWGQEGLPYRKVAEARRLNDYLLGVATRPSPVSKSFKHHIARRRHAAAVHEADGLFHWLSAKEAGEIILAGDFRFSICARSGLLQCMRRGVRHDALTIIKQKLAAGEWELQEPGETK